MPPLSIYPLGSRDVFDSEFRGESRSRSSSKQSCKIRGQSSTVRPFLTARVQDLGFRKITLWGGKYVKFFRAQKLRTRVLEKQGQNIAMINHVLHDYAERVSNAA